MNFTRKWVAGLAFIATSSLFAIETATVGYTSVDVKPGGFQMVCAPFVTVNENTAYDLQDLIVSGAVAGSRANNSDIIQIWDENNTTFTLYFYKEKMMNGSPRWVLTTAPSIIATDVTVKAGQAFWYKRTSQNTDPIVLAGAINPQDRVSNVIEGFNLIGSAFPKDIELNSETSPLTQENGFIASSRFSSGADSIQIWDSELQKFDTYFYKTKMSEDNLSPAWVLTTAPTNIATGVIIPAGTGFWYKRASAGTITEPSPLTLN